MKPDDAALWMPFYVGDWLADTGHLDGPEHGAYLLLILHYWRTRGPLKDDDARLARIARTAPDAWEAMRPTIAELFVVSGGLWRHKRVDKELRASQVRRSKAVHANEVRWGKEGSTPEDSSEHPNGSSEESSEESRGVQAQHNNNTTTAQHKRKRGKKRSSPAKSAGLAAEGRPSEGENGHVRTPTRQQEQVARVFEVYDRNGAERPAGGVAAKWMATFDELRLLRELDRMGSAGKLKGEAYVFTTLSGLFSEPEHMQAGEDELRAAIHAALGRYEAAGGDRTTAGTWRDETNRSRGSPKLRRMLSNALEIADERERTQREQGQRESANVRQDANTPRD